MQDAYHYARTAAGWDSAFTGERNSPSRGAYLKMANREAREAGLKVKAARTLAGAGKLANAIHEAAKAAGIDAGSGETLATLAAERAAGRA